MKTCLSVLMVLLMVSAAPAATGSYSNDFEGYGAYAETANHGGKWFPSGADGSGLADGWGNYYNWGVLAEEVQVVAPGGPHSPSNNPSGYGDSIGLTNFDATNAKGTTRPLPAVPDLAAGEIVELSILINASAQAGGGRTYVQVGSDYLAGGPDAPFSGIALDAAGAGNMRNHPLGPEPAIALPDFANGYGELKLVLYSAYHEGYEFDTTHLDVYSGPVGGPLTLRGTYGNNQLYNPTHLQLSPNLGTTMDNLNVAITPEPATMSLLALGGLAALRRRRS